DTKESMVEIRDFVAQAGYEIPIELLPFHRMGSTKYEALDMVYQAEQMAVPSPERMKELQKIVNGEG
ncbi:MAG: hypothetical protein ACRCW2_12095, partial [Cellulosilyticaceae bacterium]